MKHYQQVWFLKSDGVHIKNSGELWFSSLKQQPHWTIIWKQLGFNWPFWLSTKDVAEGEDRALYMIVQRSNWGQYIFPHYRPSRIWAFVPCFIQLFFYAKCIQKTETRDPSGESVPQCFALLTRKNKLLDFSDKEKPVQHLYLRAQS